MDDFAAIDRLLRRYADVMTHRAWDELDDVVTTDARLIFELPGGRTHEVVGPEELAAFGAAAVGQFAFYEYLPSNNVVTLLDGDRAEGRASCVEVGQGADGRWTDFFGHYDDEYVRCNGRWRIASRRYRCVALRGR